MEAPELWLSSQVEMENSNNAAEVSEEIPEEHAREYNVYSNMRFMLMTRAGVPMSLVVSTVVLPVKATLEDFRQALMRTPLVDSKYDAFLETWAKFSYLSKRDIYGKIRKLQDELTLQRLLRDEMRIPSTVTFCLEQCRNPRYSKDRQYQYSLNWIPDLSEVNGERKPRNFDDTEVLKKSSTSVVDDVEQHVSVTREKSKVLHGNAFTESQCTSVSSEGLNTYQQTNAIIEEATLSETASRQETSTNTSARSYSTSGGIPNECYDPLRMQYSQMSYSASMPGMMYPPSVPHATLPQQYIGGYVPMASQGLYGFPAPMPVTNSIPGVFPVQAPPPFFLS